LKEISTDFLRFDESRSELADADLAIDGLAIV
jgi:hypothetical protein